MNTIVGSFTAVVPMGWRIGSDAELVAVYAPDGDSFRCRHTGQRMAAQSLALQGRTECLPDLVEAMKIDRGDQPSPLAWAALRLADLGPPSDRASVRAELGRLRTRATPTVVEQLRLLGV
jgi:hypothetical protein